MFLTTRRALRLGAARLAAAAGASRQTVAGLERSGSSMRGIARFLGFVFATGAIVFVVGAAVVAAVDLEVRAGPARLLAS